MAFADYKHAILYPLTALASAGVTVGLSAWYACAHPDNPQTHPGFKAGVAGVERVERATEDFDGDGNNDWNTTWNGCTKKMIYEKTPDGRDSAIGQKVLQERVNDMMSE